MTKRMETKRVFVLTVILYIYIYIFFHDQSVHVYKSSLHFTLQYMYTDTKTCRTLINDV